MPTLPNASTERPLSPGAVALMLMLCFSWGFNQIAVKLALPVLLLIGKLRGVKFLERDGTLAPGLFAGLLFGIEFVLIFRGLLLTSASRAVVFSTPRRSSWRSAPTRCWVSGCAPRNGLDWPLVSRALRSRSASLKPMSMPMCCWAIS
jgi:hypothetical protein